MTTSNSAQAPKLFRILLPTALIVGAAVGAMLLIKTKSTETAAPQKINPALPGQVSVGSILPDFEIRKFPEGTSVKASQFKSKVTLINFWATWCEACMVEIPSIIKLRDTYKSKGFEVVAVNLDDDAKTAVPPVVKSFPGELPVFRDLEDSPLAELFDVHAIPLSIVMDQSRKVLFIETGERDWFGSDTKSQLERWLSL
jgi:thiol-disulfide isomerase/thioredoxin